MIMYKNIVVEKKNTNFKLPTKSIVVHFNFQRDIPPIGVAELRKHEGKIIADIGVKDEIFNDKKQIDILYPAIAGVQNEMKEEEAFTLSMLSLNLTPNEDIEIKNLGEQRKENDGS